MGFWTEFYARNKVRSKWWLSFCACGRMGSTHTDLHNQSRWHWAQIALIGISTSKWEGFPCFLNVTESLGMRTGFLFFVVFFFFSQIAEALFFSIYRKAIFANWPTLPMISHGQGSQPHTWRHLVLGSFHLWLCFCGGLAARYGCHVHVNNHSHTCWLRHHYRVTEAISREGT